MMDIRWPVVGHNQIICRAMHLGRMRRGIMRTHDRGRNQGGDNPLIPLSVMEFFIVLAGLSSRIAHRWGCGVLLQLDRWLKEDGRLGRRLDDGASLVLV